MSFWEDLAPSVKGYLVVAGVLIALVIGYRSCTGGDDNAPPPPRGYHPPQ
jgi:hypothetical protein